MTVDVYYAHLCPDSVRWVQNQLLTLNPTLLNAITLDFIPFGKAQVSAKSDKKGKGAKVCK